MEFWDLEGLGRRFEFEVLRVSVCKCNIVNNSILINCEITSKIATSPAISSG